MYTIKVASTAWKRSRLLTPHGIPTRLKVYACRYEDKLDAQKEIDSMTPYLYPGYKVEVVKL